MPSHDEVPKGRRSIIVNQEDTKLMFDELQIVSSIKVLCRLIEVYLMIGTARVTWRFVLLQFAPYAFAVMSQPRPG